MTTTTAAPFDENKVILQANALTTSRHAFTACQLDLFFMILASLDAQDVPDKFYQVFISDIKAITGREWHIQQLRESITTLGSKAVEIEYDEDSGVILWPFRKIIYRKGKGLLEVQLTEDIRPLLFDLKEKFTVMQLRSVLRCSSKFSKRLYALACQWRSAGIYTITIAELKNMLSLTDANGKAKYPKFNDFKRTVLDTAMLQINELTDIELQYELLRKNKGSNAFTSIKFFIGVRNTTQLEIDFKKSVEEQKRITEITAYGISEAMAQKMQKHLTFFRRTVEDLTKQVLEGKQVADFPAYIVGVFQRQKLI